MCVWCCVDSSRLQLEKCIPCCTLSSMDKPSKVERTQRTASDGWRCSRCALSNSSGFQRPKYLYGDIRAHKRLCLIGEVYT